MYFKIIILKINIALIILDLLIYSDKLYFLYIEIVVSLHSIDNKARYFFDIV